MAPKGSPRWCPGWPDGRPMADSWTPNGTLGATPPPWGFRGPQAAWSARHAGPLSSLRPWEPPRRPSWACLGTIGSQNGAPGRPNMAQLTDRLTCLSIWYLLFGLAKLSPKKVAKGTKRGIQRVNPNTGHLIGAFLHKRRPQGASATPKWPPKGCPRWRARRQVAHRWVLAAPSDPGRGLWGPKIGPQSFNKHPCTP